MSTPFKSLVPLTPRFIEIEYTAQAGECCVATTTDTSTDSGSGGEII